MRQDRDETRNPLRWHPIDLAASALIFICAILASGRVFRYPFDDEIYNLIVVERHHSALHVFRIFLFGRDIHPPLSYFLESLLHEAGLGADGLRLASVAMTLSALLLLQLVALRLVAEKTAEPLSPLLRLSAILLFGLNSLAVSQGDAIRWYPPFAFFAAGFIALTILGGRKWLLPAAAILGLAASTSLLAVFLLIPFAIYRYGFQRRFAAAIDLPFYLVLALFSLPGLISFASATLRPDFHHLIRSQFSMGGITAILASGLGFFGGNALGLSQAWMALPFALVTLAALILTFDRENLANPANFLVLLVIALLGWPLLGFWKTRSFLYIAPVVSGLIVLFIDRTHRRHGATAALAAVAMVVAASVAGIANLDGTTHPFKRNAAIPFGRMMDFITTNQKGKTLVVSTDHVLAWLLRKDAKNPDFCVSYLGGGRCFPPDWRYDTVFVAAGHYGARSRPARVNRRLVAKLEEIRHTYRKIAIIHVGRDDDAALKQALTHVHLGKAIMTVTMFRSPAAR